MSRRFLGWDGWQDGVTSYWHQDSEGNWAEEKVQDPSVLLDLNKEASNHCNPYNAERDVRMVARIPLIVVAKWRNELGIDYFNPNHQKAVDRLLDSNEWRWLRTDTGNSPAVYVKPKLIMPEPGFNPPRSSMVLS